MHHFDQEQSEHCQKNAVIALALELIWADCGSSGEIPTEL